MTVKELIKHLQNFNPELEVIQTRYSDYIPLEKDDIEVGKAIPSEPGQSWLRKYYPHMEETEPEVAKKVKEYLHFEGN
jgi:hypothetical protein